MNTPLIDGWSPPPITQVNRPVTTQVTSTPTPGGGVIPGGDPNVLAQLTGLTAQQIAAAQQALLNQLNLGQAQVGIDQSNLEFTREWGNKEIDRQSDEANQGVINNAVQRGIYNSGIRVEGQQEVEELRGESHMLLERDISLGLQNLQMRLAQLSSDYNLGLTNAALDYTMQDLLFAQDYITSSGGLSAGTASGFGNTDPANIAAAQAGIGPYGARVQIATQYGQMLASEFGLAADGIGYFRPATESVGGGRSENSDHITAGAVDFHLNPADPTEFAKGQALISKLNQLMAQGIVSGYIWNPNDPNDPHYGHIHVSFALPGGIANVTGAYYGGAPGTANTTSGGGFGGTVASPIINAPTKTAGGVIV